MKLSHLIFGIVAECYTSATRVAHLLRSYALHCALSVIHALLHRRFLVIYSQEQKIWIDKNLNIAETINEINGMVKSRQLMIPKEIFFPFG